MPSIPQIDRQTISNLTGTLSFTIWLFAQSPQLYENYRRGSVDGLSPVFLTQWMLGDATNLIGCVLTQQLPFQIAVATYFCCIDVCIMLQYGYYWNKARRERKRDTKRRRGGESLTASYGVNNPYSVLSETSELLQARTRHASLLRSGSRRRNLSHSQQLSRDMVEDTKHHSGSRSRSRHPPTALSRTGSSDTVAALANYRALSDAALSVAQLAQEAARRREAMLHRAEAGDEDCFSHRKPHRSKSRTGSSPNHSAPGSRSRSRVNSGELDRVDLAAIEEVEGAKEGGRRNDFARSMSSRRKAKTGNVEFVPSALSPTRESRDDQPGTTLKGNEETQEEEEVESASASEADSGDANAAAMADSVASLATNSTDASVHSLVVEHRGRDMVRTATRIESGVCTPGIVGAQRQGTGSPFSANSSDGTARHASPQPSERVDRLSRSHHQLGQQTDGDSSDEGEDQAKASTRSKGKRIVRETSPSAMYRSIDALITTANSESREGLRGKKRTMTRSSSSRSHSKRLASSALIGMTSTQPSGSSKKKRTGTKSPASMRRSIGMVLLGIMLISSTPASLSSPTPISSSFQTLSPNTPSTLLSLLDDGTAASWNRLIGRISAWLCALLYITSRIPQIWENHIRTSVAGLSILLFIAAFSGNLLYTISVLSNPEAVGEGKRAYLQESLPFLLGSGGTLVFDLMIVGQWLAWRKNE